MELFTGKPMRIDCDGVATPQCNRNTDPNYQNDTALHTSGDEPLNAAVLPYVVIPGASDRWDYKANGIEPGAAVAVIYNGSLRYGVFGDIGPKHAIGEASYAMAESLGLDPDPTTGGMGEAEIIYIVFPNSRVSPAESSAVAEAVGKRLLKKLVEDNK